MVEKAETKIALSVATRKSAARAIENPAPAAGPGIAATTGLEVCEMRLISTFDFGGGGQGFLHASSIRLLRRD